MSRDLKIHVATSLLCSGYVHRLHKSEEQWIREGYDLAEKVIAEGDRRRDAEFKKLGPIPEPGTGHRPRPEPTTAPSSGAAVPREG